MVSNHPACVPSPFQAHSPEGTAGERLGESDT